MKNREKFSNELIDFALKGTSIGLKDGKPVPCEDVSCGECECNCKDLTDWGEQEYIEPQEIDWSKVPVDTKILVSNGGTNWKKRHFCKYENGEVIAWSDGYTSWSAEDHDDDYVGWKYAKLAEYEKEETDDEKTIEAAWSIKNY